jgi:DNA modification methylase
MTPYYTDPLVTLLHGDCIEVLAEFEADSVDAVVTDPPYGLEFMGKEWDRFGGETVDAVAQGGFQDGNGGNPFSRSRVRFQNGGGASFQAWCEQWGREALRVTKPGGYLLAFGGTRTHQRLVCALEDAGWIIRDELDWIYASGFPKGKANLKPAHEPIVLARKPGPLRPLGIDECRITWANPNDAAAAAVGYSKSMAAGNSAERVSFPTNYVKPPYEPDKMQGRWPSNVLLSDPELFDQPNPYVVGSGATSDSGEPHQVRRRATSLYEGGWASTDEGFAMGGSGGYSRFFIIPKADRAERERGLADRPKAETRSYGDRAQGPLPQQTPQAAVVRANVHPTVKPIDLMRHLVRLVTPPGGVVLDPFLGSGTTCLAASEEGFRSIGIEREAEYLEIAKGRLMATPMGLGLDVPAASGPRPKQGNNARKSKTKGDGHVADSYGGFKQPPRAWGMPNDEEPAA